MRFVMIIAVLSLLAPLPAAAQDVCADQRRACQMKRELGEQGQGNCRAYRACMREICPQLRQACMFKDESGERGQGNCKRYRATCRS